MTETRFKRLLQDAREIWSGMTFQNYGPQVETPAAEDAWRATRYEVPAFADRHDSNAAQRGTITGDLPTQISGRLRSPR